VNDQHVAEAPTPPIEAEEMSEAEAKAMREESRGLSLEELHVSMSNVYRRAHRGHIAQARAWFLLWAGRQVKDVAQAIVERDDRREQLLEQRALRIAVEQGNGMAALGDLSDIAALSFTDTDSSVVVNGQDTEVQS